MPVAPVVVVEEKGATLLEVCTAVEVLVVAAVVDVVVCLVLTAPLSHPFVVFVVPVVGDVGELLEPVPAVMVVVRNVI